MTDLPDPAATDPGPEVVAVIDSGGLPDLSALDGIEVELDAVARALERLDEGTYGACEACGGELPDALLATTPAARRCEAHTG